MVWVLGSPSPRILLVFKLRPHATATVMQRGQKSLLFRLEKKSVAETLLFLKVPTTGAGWLRLCLGSPRRIRPSFLVWELV